MIEEKLRQSILKSTLIAVIAPFALAATYLTITRSLGISDTTILDWVALAFCVGVGLVGIISLPTSLVGRIGISIVYVPVISGGLFYFFLIFVCSIFDLCL